MKKMNQRTGRKQLRMADQTHDPGGAAAVHMLTTAQAARRCGVTPGTMRAWRYRGHSPPYTRASATNSMRAPCRYRQDDLDSWLAERRFTSTAEENSRARQHEGDPN